MKLLDLECIWLLTDWDMSWSLCNRLIWIVVVLVGTFLLLFYSLDVLIFTIIMHSSIVWSWSRRLTDIVISVSTAVAHLCLISHLISCWWLIMLLGIRSSLNLCHIETNIIFLILLNELLMLLLGPKFGQFKINLLVNSSPSILIFVVGLLVSHNDGFKCSLWISISHNLLE